MANLLHTILEQQDLGDDTTKAEAQLADMIGQNLLALTTAV